MRRPWSTWTALLFAVLAALIGWFDTDPARWVMVGALGLLALGTAIHHGMELGVGQTLDHAGMHATMAAVAAHGFLANPWGVLGASVAALLVIEVGLDVDIEVAMGGYVGVISSALIISGAWFGWIMGLGLLGLAYGALAQHGDRWHAVWHGLAAAGIGLWWWSAGGGVL